MYLREESREHEEGTRKKRKRNEININSMTFNHPKNRLVINTKRIEMAGKDPDDILVDHPGQLK